MNHMEEVFIAMIVFGAISYIITQFFNHRQRMRMIETGITKLEFSSTRSRNASSIKYCLVAIALGSAIFISQIADETGAFRGRDLGFALVPIFIGTALIISAIIERKFEKNSESGTDAMEVKR